MAKFTYNNQKEKLSVDKFNLFIHPWECTSWPHDVGIDLIVQPFDEKERDYTDNSLTPFERRFLVQLKSTENEKQKAASNIGKLIIDVKHLIDWRKQKDPVMIARYYIKENCFYYNWISRIKIKDKQKSQTIYLDRILSSSTSEKAKDDILSQLTPLNRENFAYIPNILNPNLAMGQISLGNIKYDQQLQDAVQSGILQDGERKLIINDYIYRLSLGLFEEPNNLTKRFELVVNYLALDKYEEAKKELAILIQKHNLAEARILFSILSKGKYNIIKKLERQGQLYFEFVSYLKWKQETPPGTYVKMHVVLDGEHYVLDTYDEKGVILPKQNFANDDVYFEMNTSISTSTPTIYNDEIYLMKGLLDLDGNIYYEYSEVLKKYEIN